MSHAIPHQKKIKFNSLNASFTSVSAAGEKQHGTNASLVVIDEAHAAPQSIYDSLRWAIAARPNGLLVVISTSGKDQTHWYYQQVYQKSKRILNGTDTDDITHYAQVHEADADGNPEDEEQWKKANPLLGSPWADADQFRRDCQSAKSAGIGEWLNFCRLRLNQWKEASELAWLPIGSEWDSFRREFTDDELRQWEAVGGYDGGETTDPCSATTMFRLPDNRFFIRSRAWVAEEGAKEREAQNLPLYRQFQANGELELTSGNLADYPRIRNYLLDECQRWNVKVVQADPRSALVMLHEISEQGYEVATVRQNFASYNGVMKEFARAYHEGRIFHDGSSWLRYCLSNVRVEISRYDEMRPIRHKSVDKIDGAVSALLAFHGLLSQPTYVPTISW